MKSSWQKIKLGDACTLIKGVTYKSEDYASVDDGVVFLTLKAIAKGGGFNFDGVKYYKGETHDDQFVTPNDLIIANTDLTRAGDVIGAPLFVPQIDKESKYVYSMDITKIITDESKLNRNYLYHYLLTNNVRNYMRGISNGSTVLHLKVNLVNKLDIPLPSLEIQAKIVQILSGIDAEIRYTNQIVQKTEVLKQGLMRQLLIKGIGHKKFRKTQFGSIPETWIVKKLDDQIEFKNGFAFNTSSYTDDGKTVLRMSNIGTDGRLNVNGDNVKFVPNELYEELSDFTLRKNDLVIAMTDVTKELGIVGKTAIVDKDNTYILNQRVGRIRPKTALDKRFLHYFTNSAYWLDPIHKKVTGSAQFNLSTHDIREAQILVPPYDEQTKIVELLDNTDSKIINENATKERLINLKKGLMQDIFSQKVSVN